MAQDATIKHSKVVASSPVYYGWIVLFAATIGMAASIPGQTAGISLFIDSFIRDLGLSRSVVSLAYTLATVTGALSLPFIGRAIDRFGPRKSAVAIIAMFAASLFLLGQASGLITLFAGFALVRAMAPGALTMVSQHVVNLWFVRKRGTAIGLLGVGLAIATAFFPPLIEHLLSSMHWRSVMSLLSVILIVGVLPLALLFFREEPERFGLRPDGAVDGIDADVIEEEVLTLSQARRTARFWILTFGGVCVGGLGTGLLFHHFAILGASGVSRADAALFFVPLGAMTAMGNLGAGVILDRFSPLKLMSIQLAFFGSIILALPFAGSATDVWLYGLAFGGVQGMQGAIIGSAYARYYGRAHLGSIKGFVKTIFVAGTAIGPVVYAVGPEVLGSMSLALQVTAIVPFALALAALRVGGASR